MFNTNINDWLTSNRQYQLIREKTTDHQLIISTTKRAEIQLDQPSETDTTNQLRRDREGYGKSKNTYEKLSSRRIYWCSNPSSILTFWQAMFEKQKKNAQTSLDHCTVGCASSKALIRRCQVLLRCLRLTANLFFRCLFFGELCLKSRQQILKQARITAVLDAPHQKLSYGDLRCF